MRLLPEDEHNRALLASVRPEDWRNPTAHRRYDLVVIGGGPAGLVAAAGAAGLGARTALIEERLLGGDCLNFGCVPSKALLRSGRAAAELARAPALGVDPGAGARVDFSAVMRRLRALRAGLAPADSAERFAGLGVDVHLGRARFASPDSVEVAGQTLRFKRAVIASGARPAVPAVPGLAEAGCLTNETVFSLAERPRRLAVIGGGPVGCELAQAFARLGSSVVLIHGRDRLLPREDPEASALVEAALRRDGVELALSARPSAVRAEGGRKVVRFGEREETVDEILVAAGRLPNVETLGLEAAGVSAGPGGVVVDDFGRTSNRRVFAAGDVCLPAKFTHMADASARLVLQNALFLGRKRLSALAVPWCTYTDPEVARVGALGGRAITVPWSGLDRAVVDGDGEGFLRVHLAPGSDRILGATVVGPHAGELIGELSLAMSAGLGLAALGRAVRPYPTRSEALRKAADAYNRTRLTGPVKALLAGWLRLLR